MWSYLLATWWVYFGLLHRALGNRSGREQEYRRAVACFTRALAHAPADARLYYWRGTLYWRELGDPPQAEADLSRAIELNPRLARAHLNRAFVRWYAFPRDRDGAEADLRAYLAQDDDPQWQAVAMEHLQQIGRGDSPTP